MSSGRLRLQDMTSPQIAEAMEGGARTVVFAAGATEQHGPHLPLITDTLIGDLLSGAVAELLGEALAGPALPFGISPHHMPFAGTVSLRKETFLQVLGDYVDSLAQHGFEQILIIGSHGGNFGAIEEFVRERGGRTGDAQLRAYADLMRFTEFLGSLNTQQGIRPEEGGTHAGESETSMVLASRPDLVHMDHAARGFAGELTQELVDSLFAQGMPALSEIGVVGDPRAARAEHGRFYLAQLAAHIAAHFQGER